MIKSIVLALSLAATLCAAGLDDLDRSLQQGAESADIEESYVSYDLHQDLHYFRDDYVNEAFNRKKYLNTAITMGGQDRDMTGRQVRSALNPFAVGLKSLGKLGVSTDRWDVKENGKQQFAAIYHGYNGNFVVNKLRANLLRGLINSVQSSLPALDQAQSGDLEKFKGTVFDEVSDIIKNKLKETDEEIRDLMNTNDDSSATATVVIVTDKHYIVVNVGDNNAVAYNSMNEVVNLTPIKPGQSLEDRKKNVFGARKSRAFSLEPEVAIYPKKFLDEDEDEANVHYILLESPLVSQLVSDEEASKIVLGEIVQHRESLDQEQKMFEDSITRLLQTATDRVAGVSKVFFPELFQKSDYAAIFIGLDRDYKNIH